MLVLVGVGGEEHIWEELLEAVSCVARPVFYVRSDRLIQLHQKVLRRSAELLDDFIPLVDVCGADVKETERARGSGTVTSLTNIRHTGVLSLPVTRSSSIQPSDDGDDGGGLAEMMRLDGKH